MANDRLLILLPGNQLFGQEQALIGIAKILRTYGIDAHFLLHAKWGETIAEHLERLGFSFTMLPLGTLWSARLVLREPKILAGNLLSVIKTSLSLANLIRRDRFSHIVLGNSTFSLYLLPALYLTKLPAIYRHGDDAPDHSAFHRAAMKLLFKRVDGHTANCQYLRIRLATRFPGIDPVVIYNTPWREVPPNELMGALAQCESFQSGKRIVFVGQLSEQKGVLILLEAFRILAPSHPDLVVDLVGEIPGVGECKVDRVSSALQRIMTDYPNRFFQYGFQDDVSQYYQRADLHVCPSVWQEPSPNVVLEAKQHGLPSVAFNVGGVAELINHKNDGFVCEQVSAEDLSRGIRYFLDDERARLQAGAAAKQSIADKFSQGRLGAQWLELLRALEPGPSNA